MDIDEINDKATEAADHLSVEEKKNKAKEVTLGRILNNEDFKRIDAAQLMKQVCHFFLIFVPYRQPIGMTCQAKDYKMDHLLG